MVNNLDLTRYSPLLNKLLSEEESFELMSYGAVMEGQISYNRKDEYLSLIKEYLAERINPNIFKSEFVEMQKEDGQAQISFKKDLTQLLTFSIDSKSNEFSSLIEKIFYECMLAFEYETEEMNEDEFRDFIKNIFFQIQNFLDK